MSLTAFIGRCPHCGHDHGENSLFDVARGTLTPSQQAQVNEQFANYAKQKPHLYGGCDEITTLREQAEKLTKDVEYWKADSAAAWDKCDERRLENEKLTDANERMGRHVTLAEQQLAAMTKERDEWKNDAINGGNAGYLREQLAALAEQNAKMREALVDCEQALDECRDYPITYDSVIEAPSLPNLATPVLNRIKVEGMRVAAEILIDSMDRAAAQKIRAQADELEKQNG